MEPAACLDDLAQMPGFKRERGLLKRLLHLALGEEAKVSAVLGRRAVRVLRGESGELLGVGDFSGIRGIALDLVHVARKDCDCFGPRARNIFLENISLKFSLRISKKVVDQTHLFPTRRSPTPGMLNEQMTRSDFRRLVRTCFFSLGKVLSSARQVVDLLWGEAGRRIPAGCFGLRIEEVRKIAGV